MIILKLKKLKMIRISAVIIFISSVILIQNDSEKITKNNDDGTAKSNSIYFVTDFSGLRDTVYTDKPYFIEVNLKTQMGYLHSRSDSTKSFGISSGTDKLFEGVNTKEGLFVIQSMMPQWHSRQFDSTLMLNWMGFNYGIGFHALLGNRYYKYLGVKPSSHGCVRVGREDAKEIYNKIELGTPVLVHSENNAITVAFTKEYEKYHLLEFDSLKKILEIRYNELYSGRYLLQSQDKLLIDRSNVNHSGIPIGESKRISKRQLLLPVYNYIGLIIPGIKIPEAIESKPKSGSSLLFNPSTKSILDPNTFLSN